MLWEKFPGFRDRVPRNTDDNTVHHRGGGGGSVVGGISVTVTRLLKPSLVKDY